MKEILILILLVGQFYTSTAKSDSLQNEKQLYKDAFAEQLQMLKGEKTISFKRAVFLAENAFHKSQLDYPTFCKDITTTGQQLKTLIKQRGLEKYKTAGNWAVFSYMMDSIPTNNFKPCTYDFTDFMGDKDYTKMFVTKLMKTRSGNCHSLPSYYKILCEEIGAKAFLALAPNHLYIKHIDEKGQWTNVELTNGGFPRDQWIIKEMAIPIEAIKSEAYMKPLTDKESIALCMFDLATAYQFQYGYDEFVLNTANTALKYFPKCLPLVMTISNCYKTLGETEQSKTNLNIEIAKKYYLAYSQALDKMNALGYKDGTPEHYEEWVKNVEQEKQKRGVTSNNK